MANSIEHFESPKTQDARAAESCLNEVNQSRQESSLNSCTGRASSTDGVQELSFDYSLYQSAEQKVPQCPMLNENSAAFRESNRISSSINISGNRLHEFPRKDSSRDGGRAESVDECIVTKPERVDRCPSNAQVYESLQRLLETIHLMKTATTAPDQLSKCAKSADSESQEAAKKPRPLPRPRPVPIPPPDDEIPDSWG